MPEAKRTLVKSGPELWAELTDPGALAGHLRPFGSVRITRTTPETLVEWEGDRASGAVHLEPSGFGTRVILTAALPEVEEPEPEPETEPQRGWFSRLFRREAEPAEAESPPEPAPPGLDARQVLEDCLEALGSARHRPFSRV